MLAFHVTLADNLNSIVGHGIDPRRSTGKRKTCWFVSKSMLAWAIAHIAAKTKRPVSDLIVFSINLKYCDLQKTRMRGVYQLDRACYPTAFPRPANVYLNLDDEPERLVDQQVEPLATQTDIYSFIGGKNAS